MILALLLCGTAPTLAQTATSTPQHTPLQKTIGQAKPEIVPSLIVMNARGASLQGGKLTLTGVALKLNRFRGSSGAGGGAFAHDRSAGGMVAKQCQR